MMWSVWKRVRDEVNHMSTALPINHLNMKGILVTVWWRRFRDHIIMTNTTCVWFGWGTSTAAAVYCGCVSQHLVIYTLTVTHLLWSIQCNCMHTYSDFHNISVLIELGGRQSQMLSPPYRFPHLRLPGGCRGPGRAEPAGWSEDLETRRSDRSRQHRLLYAPGWRVYFAALPSLQQQAGQDTRWDRGRRCVALAAKRNELCLCQCLSPWRPQSLHVCGFTLSFIRNVLRDKERGRKKYGKYSKDVFHIRQLMMNHDRCLARSRRRLGRQMILRRFFNIFNKCDQQMLCYRGPKRSNFLFSCYGDVRFLGRGLKRDCLLILWL